MDIKLRNKQLYLRNTSCKDTDAIFAHFHISKKKRYEYYISNRISVNNRPIPHNQALQAQDSVRISLHMEKDTIEPWYEDIKSCMRMNCFVS